MIVITMTTVGYGDFYPSTDFGRVFTGFACITGLLIVSIFVIYSFMAVEFNKEETLSYSRFVDIEKEARVRNRAVDVIKSNFRISHQKDLMGKFKHYFDLRRKSQLFVNEYLNIFGEKELESLFFEIFYRSNCYLDGIKREINIYDTCQFSIARMKKKSRVDCEKLKEAIETQKKLKESLFEMMHKLKQQ